MNFFYTRRCSEVAEDARVSGRTSIESARELQTPREKYPVIQSRYPLGEECGKGC